MLSLSSYWSLSEDIFQVDSASEMHSDGNKNVWDVV